MLLLFITNNIHFIEFFIQTWILNACRSAILFQKSIQSMILFYHFCFFVRLSYFFFFLNESGIFSFCRLMWLECLFSIWEFSSSFLNFHHRLELYCIYVYRQQNQSRLGCGEHSFVTTNFTLLLNDMGRTPHFWHFISHHAFCHT